MLAVQKLGQEAVEAGLQLDKIVEKITAAMTQLHLADEYGK